MKKIIATENGKITIRGNGTWIPVEYKQADWSNGEKVPCFKYKDEHVFLDEIIVTDPRGVFGEFDGVLGLSYFNGILIKLNPSGDAVQVYYFYC